MVKLILIYIYVYLLFQEILYCNKATLELNKILKKLFILKPLYNHYKTLYRFIELGVFVALLSLPQPFVLEGLMRRWVYLPMN